jgi:hypothetical protein
MWRGIGWRAVVAGDLSGDWRKGNGGHAGYLHGRHFDYVELGGPEARTSLQG